MKMLLESASPKLKMAIESTTPGLKMLISDLALPNLLFEPDTFIQFESGPFNASELSSITYVIKLGQVVGTRENRVWGTDTGNSETNILEDGLSASIQRSGTGEIKSIGPLLVDTEYLCEELVDSSPGTLFYNITGFSPVFFNVASTGLDQGPWKIGLGYKGFIKDFKIYDNSLTISHHWPINDDVVDGGVIKDIVGNLDGILTLGSGSWQEYE